MSETAATNAVFYIYATEITDPRDETVPAVRRTMDPDVSLSPERFLALFIFCFGSFMSGIFFAEYAIIGDVIMSFYDVNLFAVTSTAMVFLLGFVLPVYPTNLLLKLKGFRIVFIVGTSLITLGAWIRCAGIGPGYFWALILGHVLIALAQCCFLPVTTLFSSTWFGPNEVSRACSVGLFSNILGVALSCLIPSLLVTGVTTEDLKYQLFFLHCSFAVACTIALFLAIFGLKDRPDSPPSLSQKLIRESESDGTKTLRNSMTNLNLTFVDLIKNTNCVLQIVASGINFGIMNTLPTIMNEMILSFYPNANKDVGILGLLILLVGIPSSLIFGSLLDRTRKYKQMFVFTSLGSLLGILFFTGSLYYRIHLIYLSVIVLGFFQSGYLMVGLEFGAEISYPLPEYASSGLILGIGGLLGLVQAYFSTWILQISGVLETNMVILFFYLTQTVISVFIKSDLKRLEVNSVKDAVTVE